MSGTTFLEEIVSWDDEIRADRVEEALPRLIICLENHSSYDEATGILQILCQSFVPMVQQHQLEQKVFSKMSHQVCALMDHVTEDLHDAVAEGQDTDCDHLIRMLQHIASIVQCVEECVKHMAGVADLQTCQVRSLMICSFHVLKGSYSHCQQSSSLYGDRLPLLSNALSLIFRTAHSLQMTLLNMVARLTAQLDSKQDVQDVAEMCGSLFALCRLVACLDLKLTISLWKALSKLAGHQPGVLCDHIDVSGMVCYLCEEISTGVAHLLQSAPPANDQEELMLSQSDEKAFTKSLRILGFQMKVLNALVRDYHDYLSDSVPGIHKLLLYLNSVLPPSLSAPRLQEKEVNEIRQQLCNVTQPLTSHLLSNSTFTRCLLTDEDSEEKSEFACLLLQVMVMDGVAQASVEVVTQWLDTSTQLPDRRPRPNLLTAIFVSLSKCHVEVCLPVCLLDLPCEGQPERNLSAYQFVVEHVCAFIASCPAKLFHTIEEALLHALLSSNPISSQAAADCWCFMARYGTGDLCWHHTQQVLSLVLHINSLLPPFCSSASPLTSLFCRLVKFLTPQHQAELVCLAPPADHLSVWARVNLSMMSGEVGTEVCQALVPRCLQSLHDFSHRPSTSLVHAATVIPSLLCLHTIAQNSATAHHLTKQQGAQLLDLVSSMWKKIPPDHPISPPTPGDAGVTHRFLSALVTLTSDIVDQLEVTLLLQVLTIAHKLLTGSASGDLTLAVVQLVQHLGPLRFPPSFEQGQILRKISDVFAAGLTHKTALVQYAALEAFTRFAEHTAYEAVVPECLAQHDGLQDKVAAFLQKVPFLEKHQFDPVQYLQGQRQHFTTRVDTPAAPDRQTEGRSSEPQGKRQRLEDPASLGQLSDCYERVLDELETLTQRVEKLQTDSAMPDWAVARGKLLLPRWSGCWNQR